ncbi:MAG: MarR family winged helix-turn-helix transcriptional regulator [Methanobacteriota archaeon]
MRFTDNEKATLYGLVKYPDLNDRELADRIDAKLSTVTAIRRRLLENGVLKDVTLPMMDALGSEILVIGYGPLNPSNKNAHSEMARKISGTCGCAFLLADAMDYGFFVGCANNYTDIKSDLDGLNHYLTHAGLGSEPWNYALFPFAVSKILNCFDFSPTLSSAIGIEQESAALDLGFKKLKRADLSLKEKAVLKGIVSNPGVPDSHLADIVDVSRQAIAEMKRRFIDEGIVRNIRVPDLRQVGCELVTLTHSQFNPRSQLVERKEGIRLMMDESPHLFAVSGSFENVMLHSHVSYSHLDAVKKRLLGYYKTHDFIRGEPRISIFLTANMSFPIWFKFDNILEKTLGTS